MAESETRRDDNPSKGLASAFTAKDVAARSTMQLSIEQKRAFDKLLAKSEGKGIILTEDKKQDEGRLAPATWPWRYYEDTFDCPVGFAVLAKDFLPTDARPQSIRDAAVRAVAGTCERDIADMMSLVSLLLDGINELAKSKVNRYVSDVLKTAELYHDGNKVKSKEQLYTMWNNENPTAETIIKVHGIIYGSFEQEGVIKRMVYEIQMALRMWPEVTKRIVWKKEPACPVQTRVRNKIRDLIRNRYTKQKQIKHGVTLKISVSRENGMKRRGRTGDDFPFERNVKGWRSDKHVAWALSNHVDIPFIDRLETPLIPITRKEKEKV